MEAGTDADVTDWLDRPALLAVWSQLYLPSFVREAWERRHPELGCACPRLPVPRVP
jgi:hypothetical protein